MNYQLPGKPLEPRRHGGDGFTVERWTQVLYLDPLPLLTRIQPLIDPYRRHQGLSAAQVWPNKPGICACGCHGQLRGRQRRWAGPDHTWAAIQILRIINGDVDVIADYIRRYHGDCCADCKITSDDLWHRDQAPLNLDHIIPVKHGGGGTWLSNYQLLCPGCHRVKTNRDFGWKQPPPQLQSLGLFGE